jgi:hypothetical protein
VIARNDEVHTVVLLVRIDALPFNNAPSLRYKRVQHANRAVVCRQYSLVSKDDNPAAQDGVEVTHKMTRTCDLKRVLRRKDLGEPMEESRLARTLATDQDNGYARQTTWLLNSESHPAQEIVEVLLVPPTNVRENVFTKE